MEGADFVAVLFGDGFFGEELVGAVAVNLNVELAAEDVGEGFEFEVALWRDGVLVAFLHFRVVSIPLGHIVFRVFEGHAHDFEIAHAGGGELIAAAVDALGIFAGGKLDGAGALGKSMASRSRPNLFLMTTAWPPIMLAEPWRRSSVVTPPARAR